MTVGKYMALFLAMDELKQTAQTKNFITQI